MADDVFAAKLRQLADRFLTALPADLTKVRGAMGAEDAADAIGGILHRIAGRAGTFGFPHITEQASQLEALVVEGRWLEAGCPSAAFETGLGILEALSTEAIEARR